MQPMATVHYNIGNRRVLHDLSTFKFMRQHLPDYILYLFHADPIKIYCKRIKVSCILTSTVSTNICNGRRYHKVLPFNPVKTVLIVFSDNSVNLDSTSVFPPS